MIFQHNKSPKQTQPNNALLAKEKINADQMQGHHPNNFIKNVCAKNKNVNLLLKAFNKI